MTQRFFIKRDPLGRSLIYFREQSPNQVAFAQSVSLRVRGPDEEGTELQAMMVVEDDALQTLIDELWNTGFRPKDVGTAGHLSATQAHLHDMKKLVSKAYGIEL